MRGATTRLCPQIWRYLRGSRKTPPAGADNDSRSTCIKQRKHEHNDGGDRPCFQEARIEKVGWPRWRVSFAVSKAFPRRRGNRRANVEHNARQALATNGPQGGCLRQWQRQTRHLHRTCAWRWSARTKRLVGRWLLARWELSLSATMGMPLCRGKCSASSERCAPLSSRAIFPTTSKLVDNGRWRWVP